MYLGIDIGSSSIKSALLTKDGRILKNKTSYPDECYKNNEHKVKYIEDTFQKNLKEIIHNNQLHKKDIKGIGICSHGPSIMFIDRTGKAITNIINWYDKRSIKEANILNNKLKGFSKDATSFEAKLLWLKNNHPEIFSAGKKVFYPKDYFNYKLTKKSSFDRSTASTIYFYNRKNDDWKTEQLDIDSNIFPHLHNPWEVIGFTSTEFSASCGLPKNIPVVGGGIDAFCEAVGAGAIAEGEVVEGTGTSTCISMCIPRKEEFNLHVIPDKSIKIHTLSFTGGAINWIIKLFSKSWDELDKLKLTEPVNVLFLPYLLGERSPIWDEKARGAFIGIDAETKKKQIIKSVIQGVMFAIKQNVEILDKYHDFTEIRAVGGGAINNNLLQLKADITNKKYIKMKDIDSAAIGAAALSALEKHESLDDVKKKWIDREREYQPDKMHHHIYEDLYEIYTGLYEKLKEDFHKLSDIKKHTN